MTEKIAFYTRPLSFRFLGLMVFCCFIFLDVDGGTAQCSNGDVVCPLVPMLVTESPTGTVNGFNNTFSLLHLPMNPSSVRLFLNGLELRQDTDYRISGSNIIVIRPVPVKQGDVLAASYETMTSPKFSLSGPTRNQELIRQVLMREVEKERASYVSDQPAGSSERKRDPGLAVTSPSTPEAIRALKMLHEQLIRSSRVSQQRPVIPALDGLEGLGDISPPSYSELSSPKSSQGDISKAPPVASRKVRSLRMLASILSQTDSVASGREK